MYGLIQKTEEEQAADREYIEKMIFENNGDTIEAAKKAARDGWHYFYTNELDLAMFRFNQSWLIDSSYPASYFGFGALSEDAGNLNEAEDYFKMAYWHDHTDSLTKKYLHQIAKIKEAQDDTLGLITSFYRVISKFPNDAIATGKLGYFYALLNKDDSAMKYYNLTIKFDPEIEDTYINRGFLFLQLHKYNDAIADYSTAIIKNGQSIKAYANRGNAFMENKQFNEAIKDINNCIELDKKHPNFHFAKAICYRELKDYKKACEEISIGISKGGDYADKLKEYNCR